MKKAVLAAAVMTLIMLFPQAAVEGARNAMAVWYKSVAPVLFPFFVLMPIMTSAEACVSYERLFSKIMKRAFDLPGAAAPAMLIVMLAGSPAGAIAIVHAVSTGMLRAHDARRMSIALCGLSPSFLILGIGQEMYGSLELGWKLAGIQIAVQLSILILTRLLQRKDIGRRAVVEVKGNTGIGKAVENILAVCGYMVMFGAISAVIGSLAGERLGNLILLALDLPGGSAKLSGMMIKGRLMLQCAAIGVGGLCIACQNMDVLKKAGVTWKDYLLGRVTAMLMFVCLGGMVLGAGEPEAVMGYVNKRVNVFAAALFFASLSIFPWIYSLEKYTFLNKRKFENEMENDGMDRNI